MQLLMTLFVAALFFVLTPGILLSLPPNGSKVTVAITHAIVFAIVYCLTHKIVYAYLYEGFKPKFSNMVKTKQPRTSPTQQGSAAMRGGR